MPDEPLKPNEVPQNPAPASGVGAPSSPELEEGQSQTREAVNPFAEAPLAVEPMAVSEQLRERRERASKIIDAVPAEGVGEVADVAAETAPFEGDSGGLADLLREANLSKRHVGFCCGGVLALLVLALIVWGAWTGLSAVFDGSESEPKTEEVVEETVNEVGNEDEVVFDEYLDSTISTAFILGENEMENDEALGAGQSLGEELVSDEALAQKIVDFAEMYELMQVDVPRLLDQSSDRRDALDDYANELNFLLYEGRKNLENLETEMANLEAQFIITEEEKLNLEQRFFDELKELDAYASVSLLDAFIVEAEKLVQLRAEHNARAKLASYYERLIIDMENRSTDINLNEEALVKGVTVVDVSGSDIDLIIDESEL